MLPAALGVRPGPAALSALRRADLAREFADQAKIDAWTLTGHGDEFGEFGQIGIRKGAAVERLAAHLGVPLTELIAFGDARSDLELLRGCGTGVAMGNAPQGEPHLPARQRSIMRCMASG